MREHDLGRLGHEPRADTAPPEVVAHMEVVEQCAPLRIIVEDRVHEADDLTVLYRDCRVFVRSARRKAAPPRSQPLPFGVAIQVFVGVHAPVATPPAVGVEPRDRLDVAGVRAPIPDHAAMFASLPSEAELFLGGAVAGAPELRIDR